MKIIPTADLCVCPEAGAPLGEWAAAARQKELHSIGIAVHSQEEYRAVCNLRQAVGNDLDILCVDVCQYFDAAKPYTPDLIIGEVQTLKTEHGTAVPLPKNALELQSVLDEFDRDIYCFLRRYFSAVSDLQGDAVRLLDAVSMWGTLFDKNDHRYRKYALEAVDALLARNAVFEIRTQPRGCGEPIAYPSVMLLRRIGERRGRVVLSSGAALPDHMCASFGEAILLLRACGIGGICEKKFDKWIQNSI